MNNQSARIVKQMETKRRKKRHKHYHDAVKKLNEPMWLSNGEPPFSEKRKKILINQYLVLKNYPGSKEMKAW